MLKPYKGHGSSADRIHGDRLAQAEAVRRAAVDALAGIAIPQPVAVVEDEEETIECSYCSGTGWKQGWGSSYDTYGDPMCGACRGTGELEAEEA